MTCLLLYLTGFSSSGSRCIAFATFLFPLRSFVLYHQINTDIN